MPTQYLRFEDVPDVFTRSPRVFTGLMQAARCRNIDAFILGDSQETSPGGAGAVYVPRINYEFARRYNAITRSPWLPMAASYGDAAPAAKWMACGGSGDSTPGDLERYLTPPGLSPAKVSANTGNNVNANQWLGQLISLNATGSRLPIEAGIPRLDGMFPLDQGVYVDVIGVARPQSGEIVADFKPCPVEAARFYVPVMGTSVSSVGLDIEEEFWPAFKRARFGPFFLPPDDAQIQVELSGSSSYQITEILTARFVSAAPGKGWCFSDIAAGGYTSSTLRDFHFGCGLALSTMKADVVFMMYGANDSGQGVTPEQFHDRLIANIAYIRGWLGQQTPIVLIADVYRTFNPPNPEYSAALDRYPGVAYAIAQEDPLVAAVNIRRTLDYWGWSEQYAPYFLSDNVHYTPYGATIKAQFEAELMFNAWDAPGCYLVADVASAGGQPRPDGELTVDDIVVYLAGFFEGNAAIADIAQVGGAPGIDRRITADDLIFFLSSFFTPRP